jgi:hypothetical protein
MDSQARRAAIRWCLQQAADHMAYLSHETEDDDEADFLTSCCNWSRDLADRVEPPAEDWGGANIVRFPIERR